MKQVDLQGNVYDIGIEANKLSDKALEQIVGVIRPILNKKDKEIERLNNIIENFEEELEREINIKEEDTGLEHDRYLLIKDTLETMLRRFRNTQRK